MQGGSSNGKASHVVILKPEPAGVTCVHGEPKTLCLPCAGLTAAEVQKYNKYRTKGKQIRFIGQGDEGYTSVRLSSADRVLVSRSLSRVPKTEVSEWYQCLECDCSLHCWQERLRIGEALGLKIHDFSDECRVLHVRRSVWRGREQSPKTANALRVIDVSEPLAELLREHIATKDSRYLFSAKSGRPLQQRNVLRALHASGKKIGFHAFRRFRTETLRRARVPEDLIRLWLGHAKHSLTDLYAGGLENDEGWRQECASVPGSVST